MGSASQPLPNLPRQRRAQTGTPQRRQGMVQSVDGRACRGLRGIREPDPDAGGLSEIAGAAYLNVSGHRCSRAVRKSASICGNRGANASLRCLIHLSQGATVPPFSEEDCTRA